MYKEYFPKHSENRMKNEGNVIAAREYFLTGKNRILYNLVKKRFSWMNKYIRGGGTALYWNWAAVQDCRNFL